MASALSHLRPFDPLRFTKRVVTAAEWRQMVAEAAYYRAELRHFAPDHEVDDWLAAEREVGERVVVVSGAPSRID
jgi:hypothetical protein